MKPSCQSSSCARKARKPLKKLSTVSICWLNCIRLRYSTFCLVFFHIYYSDLRKEPNTQNTIDFGNDTIGYKFHNVTKYYENDLVFLSHESKHINLVPIELLEQIEGVIVYFDSDNVRISPQNQSMRTHCCVKDIFNRLCFTERFSA